ncbi:hypothetical protein F5B19DRAFT_474727 [Rostrohypoxylon terebratum]|nr:hypothetical protein F5B19DRAFT_474727 [Rostrohypoxylon terebratum]
MCTTKKSFHLRISSLDLCTGFPGDGSITTSLRPLTSDEIERRLDQAKPWKSKEMTPWKPPLLLNDEQDKLWKPRRVRKILENLMNLNEDERSTGIINSTEWNFAGPYDNTCFCRGQGWELVEWLTRKDISFPHLGLILVDEAPLKDAERVHLTTAMFTIVAISGTSLRISHGNTETEHSKVSMCMTRAIELIGPDGELDRSKLNPALSWLLAEPVPSTT